MVYLTTMSVTHTTQRGVIGWWVEGNGRGLISGNVTDFGRAGQNRSRLQSRYLPCKQLTWRTIFFMYVSSYSLHVSGSHVPVIRRIIVSMRHLVYVTLCRWRSGMQVNLHTRRSSTQSDINQVSHSYNNSPDDGHVAARNMLRIERKTYMKKIVRQVGYLQGLYQDARSTKHKKSRYLVCITRPEPGVLATWPRLPRGRFKFLRLLILF